MLGGCESRVVGSALVFIYLVVCGEFGLYCAGYSSYCIHIARRYYFVLDGWFSWGFGV